MANLDSGGFEIMFLQIRLFVLHINDYASTFGKKTFTLFFLIAGLFGTDEIPSPSDLNELLNLIPRQAFHQQPKTSSEKNFRKLFSEKSSNYETSGNFSAGTTYIKIEPFEEENTLIKQIDAKVSPGNRQKNIEEILTPQLLNTYKDKGFVRIGKIMDKTQLDILQERLNKIMLGEADTPYEKMMMQLDRALSHLFEVKSFFSKCQNSRYTKLP